jgi:hypothetical protein
MKHLMVILTCLFSVVIANPIFTPDAYLSELTFRENGSWRLELYYDFFDSYGAYPWFYEYALETNEGRSNIMFHDSTLEYFEITNDNLDQDLIINKSADSIKLIIHKGNPDSPHYIDYLVIGEESGSYIIDFDYNQSISRLIGEYYYLLNYDLFFMSDSITIGAENDTSKSKSIIYGKVYDYNGQIMSNKSLSMRSNYQVVFITNEHGDYRSRILSRTYLIDNLWVYDLITKTGEDLTFEPKFIELSPGDSLRVDFHQLKTAVKPVIKNDIVKLNNYPHPASSYTWVNIGNTDVDASAMRVNVYALNGRKVDSFIPSAKQFRYDCGHLPQGSYVLSLQHGHDVLASKKLQILK